MAFSSLDVLFHLRKEEMFKRATDVEPLNMPPDPEGQGPADAMANLCRHILQQRRYAHSRAYTLECAFLISSSQFLPYLPRAAGALTRGQPRRIAF